MIGDIEPCPFDMKAMEDYAAIIAALAHHRKSMMGTTANVMPGIGGAHHSGNTKKLTGKTGRTSVYHANCAVCHNWLILPRVPDSMLLGKLCLRRDGGRNSIIGGGAKQMDGSGSVPLV